MNYKEFFKGKKITQMGLGLLGRGVGDAEFLAEMGVELTVTDLKTAKELEQSIDRLKKFTGIKFVFGEHRLEDFRNRPKSSGDDRGPDFILKAAGVPLDSPYIAEAIKNDIPVEMDASLFVKLAPKGVRIIGVTGTRGKTTTTMLLYEIVKKQLKIENCKLKIKKNVFLGGNIKDTATLPLLKEVKGGDYVVMELDSWQLQGFGDSKISPRVSVFTTFYPDHMNYYKNSMEKYLFDKQNIFKYQKRGNVLIVGEQAVDFVAKRKPPISPIVARADDFPRGWKLKIPGEHNKINAMCAILAARALKVPEEIIREAVENFGGMPGRLELIREINGVKIYNDTTATTPVAAVAGLKALGGNKKNIILILGGSDKGLDMGGLVKEIPRYCKAVILLEGTGTAKLVSNFQFPISNEFSISNVSNLKDAVNKAISLAVEGDIVLFSPAFASFGMFKNEYDRGKQFNKIVESL